MAPGILPEILTLLGSSLLLGTMFSRTIVELLETWCEGQGAQGRRNRRWR